MPKRYLRTIIVLLFFFVFFSYGYSTSVKKQAVKIYDGDTIGAAVDGRFEKIRLLGIDAPEMDQRPWGKKSRECLIALISDAASKISLEYDIERRDKYGRILAYIWTEDRKMLNEEMMKNGCAVLFTFPPNVRYAERLRAAQKKAQEQKAGLWGESGLEESPYNYRKKHPRK